MIHIRNGKQFYNILLVGVCAATLRKKNCGRKIVGKPSINNTTHGATQEAALVGIKVMNI